MIKTRKTMVATRCAAVEQMLEEDGFEYDLVHISDSGFALHVSSSGSLGDLVRRIYVKWPDLWGVSILAADHGRNLHIRFDDEELSS